MKIILSWLFILSVGYLYSQENLTPKELEYATIEYKKMMESQTYKEIEREDVEFNQKLCKVRVPINLWGDKNAYREYIIDNLAQTKFRSADEVKEMMDRSESLYTKQMSDFSELYSLMKRATPEQIKIIHKAEFDSIKANAGY
jgi:hypothetical protein